MKKKVIAVLEDIRDEIDVNASIDFSDTLVGKMVVIDAQELEATKNNINDVIKMIQNEIDFDDALKGVGAVPVITGDKDTDALLEDERLNQENCDGLLHHTINDIDNKLGQYAEKIIHSYGNELNPDEIMKAINDIQVDWWNHGEPKLKHKEKLRIISRYKQLDREHKIDWRRSCRKN